MVFFFMVKPTKGQLANQVLGVTPIYMLVSD